MLKLVLMALEILNQIQQLRVTIKVSLTYQSQCSGITYQDALKTKLLGRRHCLQAKRKPKSVIRTFTDDFINDRRRVSYQQYFCYQMHLAAL